MVCKALGIKQCKNLHELKRYTTTELNSEGAKELYYTEIGWAKCLLSITVARQVEEHRNNYLTCLRCHSIINLLLCIQERLKSEDNAIKDCVADSYFDHRKFRFDSEKDSIVRQLNKLELADAKKRDSSSAARF